MADTRVPGERLAFDADVWAEEVERLRAEAWGRRCAVAARRAAERPGARLAVRACSAEDPGGTALGCCG